MNGPRQCPLSARSERSLISDNLGVFPVENLLSLIVSDYKQAIYVSTNFSSEVSPHAMPFAVPL